MLKRRKLNDLFQGSCHLSISTDLHGIGYLPHDWGDHNNYRLVYSHSYDSILNSISLPRFTVTYFIPWVDFGLGWDSVHLVAQVTALSTLLIALSILALLRVHFLYCHRERFLQYDQSGAADYLHAFINAHQRKCPPTNA